eukprot:365254-Chlamydomonas_euryale.AAC.2
MKAGGTVVAAQQTTLRDLQVCRPVPDSRPSANVPTSSATLPLVWLAMGRTRHTAIPNLMSTYREYINSLFEHSFFRSLHRLVEVLAEIKPMSRQGFTDYAGLCCPWAGRGAPHRAPWVAFAIVPGRKLFPALVPSFPFRTWRSSRWGMSGLTPSDPFS